MLHQRSVLRSAILPLVVFAAMTHVSPASAATVSYSDMCQRDANVVQWTPQKGPIARFVVDTFLNTTQTGLWIGLGRKGTSFWSAEDGLANVVWEDCRWLSLVETRADGTRKTHVIWGPSESAQIGSDPEAPKTHMLGRLWQLAATQWPADKLTQDYALTLGKPDAARQLPFAVKVTHENAFDLRFDFGASTSMCWCVYEWRQESFRNRGQ